jgi:serine protease Do
MPGINARFDIMQPGRTISVLFMATLMSMLAANATCQDLKPESIRRGKRATALVVLDKSLGTAFCIDAAGYFVTNEHVVSKQPNGKMELVLNATESDEITLQAEVIRLDKEKDLALLKIADSKGHKFDALEIGSTSDLIETQWLVTFGYPFGDALTVKEEKYPSVSVSVGRINSLRRSEGSLERIQLDAVLNPGNSGGPVIDETGKVVGIVESGLLLTGVNFAIPANHLHELLNKPEISFESPIVKYDDRSKPLKIEVLVSHFVGNQKTYEIEAIVGNNEAPLAGKRIEDSNKYEITLIPIPDSDSTERLPVQFVFDNGFVKGLVEQKSIKVADSEIQLRDIESIQRFRDGVSIKLKDGSQNTYPSIAIGKLEVNFGNYIAQLDADKAHTLTVFALPEKPASIPITINVKHDGKTIGTRNGTIDIEKAPIIAGTAAAKSKGSIANNGISLMPGADPKFKNSQTKVIYRLPNPYESYTVAGYGRYFVFHVKEQKKILVMDVLTGETAGEIPTPMDDALIAGGATKLVIVLPGQKLIQRWNLETFKREKVAILPGNGVVREVHMGANSEGPILLCGGNGLLVDLDSLQKIETTGGPIPGGGSHGHNDRVNMSYDGRSIGSIVLGLGPVSYSHTRINGSTIERKSFDQTSNAIRWAWPTADGTLITMDGAKFYDANLNRLPTDWLKQHRVYPTVDPRYFIAVRYISDKKSGDITHVNVCTTADRRIIYTYSGMEEMAPKGNTNSRNSAVDQLYRGTTQFHYIPWADVLINIVNREEIVLRKFDLADAIVASGVDYLYVDSVPPIEAIKGSTFSYQVSVKAKHPGINFKLESGPEGMSISRDGHVTWDVPSAFHEEKVQAIISVEDDRKQTVFHTLQLAVHE